MKIKKFPRGIDPREKLDIAMATCPFCKTFEKKFVISDGSERTISNLNPVPLYLSCLLGADAVIVDKQYPEDSSKGQYYDRPYVYGIMADKKGKKHKFLKFLNTYEWKEMVVKCVECGCEWRTDRYPYDEKLLGYELDTKLMKKKHDGMELLMY